MVFECAHSGRGYRASSGAFSHDGIAHYEEFVNFIAAGPSSELVATFQPSEATRSHVADLVAARRRLA